MYRIDRQHKDSPQGFWVWVADYKTLRGAQDRALAELLKWQKLGEDERYRVSASGTSDAHTVVYE